MQLAQRISRLAVESAYEVLAKARALEKQGRSVIHLEIGEPDFPTPAHIIEAGKQALDEGWTKYGPTPGFPEFREAIAAQVSRTRGIKVGPENVCVVPGGKPTMFFAMIALIEPGDEVIYPDPAFPIYHSMVNFLEAKPVPIPLMESRAFSFDLNLLKDRLSSKTKFVILNSPANPTGGVIPKEDLSEMAAMFRERDLMVLSDEIYSRIWYEQDPGSIATFEGMAEKTIILDGFSKTYSMTGWRLGYGVMPEWLADAVNKLTVNSNSCTAVLESAVVPYQDENNITRCMAYVVLKPNVPGHPDLAAELQSFVKTRITGYKVPRRLVFLAELPKTAAGKIQRFKLRGSLEALQTFLRPSAPPRCEYVQWPR